MNTSTATLTPATKPATEASSASGLLQIDLPSMPQSMVQISLILADEDPDLQRLSKIISADMALSASIMRTLNSPLFALQKSVTTVQDAITYLGFREVASQTFQHSLRSVFPPSKQLDLIMGQATLRAFVMGRLAQLLDMPDPWAAHAGGIFQDCGKAVLLRAKGDAYAALLTKHGADDQALRNDERQLFGIGHDELSSRLCQTWGVGESTCEAIRTRVDVHAALELPSSPALRDLAFVSLVAAKVMDAPDEAVPVALSFAKAIGKSERSVSYMVDKVTAQVTFGK